MEWLCAFLVAYPDSGQESHPERVAAGFGGNPELITELDIRALKRLTDARWIKDETARALMDARAVQAALATERMPCGWDIITLDDTEWNAATDAVRELIVRLTEIDGVRVPLATKTAYLKRPCLIPICDSFILDRLVGPRRDDIDAAICAIEVVRRVGRQYAALLNDVAEHLRTHLPEPNAYRTMTRSRILDAVLWIHERARRGGYGNLLS